MNTPISRKQLQNFDPKPFLRKKAIDQTVETISQYILKAASGNIHGNFPYWKILTNHKIMIQKEIYTSKFYTRNPYSEQNEYFADILPDVIQQLQISFPDVDFRQDELGTYLIVDWS